MSRQVIEKQVQSQIKELKNADLTDVQMLLKNIKTQTKIQNKRKAAHEQQKEKAELRNKKAEQNRLLSKLQEQEKIMQIKSKQQSRESRLLNNKVEKLISKALDSPFPEGEGNNEALTNKGDKDIPHVQVYSSHHRNYIESTKNKFYEKNENLIANPYKIAGDNQENTKYNKKGNNNNNNGLLFDSNEESEDKENELKLSEKGQAIIKEFNKYKKENAVELRLKLKKENNKNALVTVLNDNDIDNKINELVKKISELQNDLKEKKK